MVILRFVSHHRQSLVLLFFRSRHIRLPTFTTPSTVKCYRANKHWCWSRRWLLSVLSNSATGGAKVMIGLQVWGANHAALPGIRLIKSLLSLPSCRWLHRIWWERTDSCEKCIKNSFLRWALRITVLLLFTQAVELVPPITLNLSRLNVRACVYIEVCSLLLCTIVAPWPKYGEK